MSNGESAESGSNSRGPCHGIRVLDLTSVVSGPVCTQHLGDLGADVIKIEPPMGDFSRLAGGVPHAGLNGFFAQYNRNKRSLVLDLKQPEAVDIIHDLAESADVLVENYRPGVADRIGIGFESLRQRNARLIYVAISGFGPTGPYADHPAYDHLIQGLTGFMPVQGEGGEPRMIQTVVGDKVGGLTALSAVLAALFERTRSGLGQRVDVPMLDAYAGFILTDAMGPRAFLDAPGNTEAGTLLFRTFETKDGRVVGVASQDRQYEALCRALDREDLLGDARFASIGARFANLSSFYELIEVELRKWPTLGFIERAHRFGAPFAPVLDVDGFLADAQVVHNQTVVTREVEGAGPTRLLRPPLRFERTPATITQSPPRLGEHSDEILAELGYDPARRADLFDRAVTK